MWNQCTHLHRLKFMYCIMCKDQEGLRTESRVLCFVYTCITDTVPPVCTSPARLSISYGAVIPGTVQVNYINALLVTFAVIPPVPVGFEFTDDRGGYIWRLQRNARVVDLRISITAPDGSCTIYQPEIFVCDCSNNGKCDFNKTTSASSARVRAASCLCTDAYDGQHCDQDRDGCKAAFQPCFSGATCADRKAPLSGYICGGCPVGFSGDGSSCFG